MIVVFPDHTHLLFLYVHIFEQGSSVAQMVERKTGDKIFASSRLTRADSMRVDNFYYFEMLSSALIQLMFCKDY